MLALLRDCTWRFCVGGCFLSIISACGRRESPPTPAVVLSADAAANEPAQSDPEPRAGMVWVGSGVLIAGTPPDRVPRVADEEMPGEQVMMRGFFIDVFSYPNEIGAIPTTSVSQSEARELCEAQGKRLCTELEIERACKGPNNTTYEDGDAYKTSTCSTGSSRVLVPNGLSASCQSPFGVRDLHGGVWQWTASPWKTSRRPPRS